MAWRSPNLLRMFVGQHIVNGLSVGFGVIFVAVVSSAVFGFDAGQPATLGAISASIADLPTPWREKARAMGFGFALALISTAAIQLGMQMLIPMVFVLGLPRESIAEAPRVEALFAVGALAYIVFSLVATIAVDPSARRLVTSESIREFSIYLRAVAAVFSPDTNLEAAYGAMIRQQAALAEQLQLARPLLLDHAEGGSERLRLAASIGVLLDAFDALVAAQCDLGFIRASRTHDRILKQIERTLDLSAADLDHLSLELLATRRQIGRASCRKECRSRWSPYH